MRARNLKPGFFKNEILGAADPLYGLLFQGLWLMADREGRLADIPRRIMAELFPYRKRVRESLVEKILAWLHQEQFIVRYEVDGRRYIQIVEFLQHQNPHQNEAPSKIPALNSVLHQSHSSNGEKLAQESAQERSGAEEQPRHKANRASSLNPSSLNHESPLTESRVRVNGSEGNVGREGEVARDGPANAWREITECDPQAYEAWLAWRADEHDVVPPRVRLQDAKFLGGKGTPQQQRAFIDELVRRRFRRLHDPSGFASGGNGLNGRKTYADYDRESADRLAALPGEDPGPL